HRVSTCTVSPPAPCLLIALCSRRAPPVRSGAGGPPAQPAAVKRSASDREPTTSTSCPRRLRRRATPPPQPASGVGVAGTLVHRAALACRQVVGRVDQPDVRERLREVAEQPLLVRVVLLRQEAEVVPDAEQPLEERTRLGRAPEKRERIDQPERA